MWPPSSAKTLDPDSVLRALASPDPVLVDVTAAAQVFSISERAFHTLRKRPDFPRDATVVLGPRCVRFRLQALHTYARSLVSVPRSEPIQLLRSRMIEAANKAGRKGKKRRRDS